MTRGRDPYLLDHCPHRLGKGRRPGAHQEDRPARPGHEPPRLREALPIDSRGQEVQRGPVAGMAGIEIEVDGPGRRLDGDEGSPPDCLGRAVEAQPSGPLGERGHGPDLVELLVADPVPARSGDRVAQEDQRETVERGLRHTVGRGGHPRPAGHDRNSGNTRQPAIRTGRYARSRFAVGEHESHPGLGPAFDHLDVGPAPGNAEDQVGPGRGESCHGRPGKAVRPGSHLFPLSQRYNSTVTNRISVSP